MLEILIRLIFTVFYGAIYVLAFFYLIIFDYDRDSLKNFFYDVVKEYMRTWKGCGDD